MVSIIYRNSTKIKNTYDLTTTIINIYRGDYNLMSTVDTHYLRRDKIRIVVVTNFIFIILLYHQLLIDWCSLLLMLKISKV